MTYLSWPGLPAETPIPESTKNEEKEPRLETLSPLWRMVIESLGHDSPEYLRILRKERPPKKIHLRDYDCGMIVMAQRHPWMGTEKFSFASAQYLRKVGSKYACIYCLHHVKEQERNERKKSIQPIPGGDPSIPG